MTGFLFPFWFCYFCLVIWQKLCTFLTYYDFFLLLSAPFITYYRVCESVHFFCLVHIKAVAMSIPCNQLCVSLHLQPDVVTVNLSTPSISGYMVVTLQLCLLHLADVINCRFLWSFCLMRKLWICPLNLSDVIECLWICLLLPALVSCESAHCSSLIL